MTIYFLGALTVLFPSLIIVWFSFTTAQSKFEWLARFLLAGGVVLIFYRIGVWSITSYYLRFAIVALFLASVFYSFLSIRTGSWHVSRDHWRRIGGTLLFALPVASLSVLTLAGAFYSGNAVSLKFPLAQGRYYVLQGGSNVMTNPFHGIAPNGKYAVDIVKINNLGNRAARLFPETLTQYNIFGDVVHSPCNGTVVSTATGLPDNSPTDVDLENSAGNHIIIECDGIRVMLAHLKKDSLRVGEGQDVREGQPVGKVGNSGYSDEPHLHIQANSLEGGRVAIKFGERFLSINDLYVVK